MEIFYNYFSKRSQKTRPRSSSISTHRDIESQVDSIYGLTNPKQLIINDIRFGLPISSTLLQFVQFNFTEVDKYDLILEYNTQLSKKTNY